MVDALAGRDLWWIATWHNSEIIVGKRKIV